jgi:hypothetical protein
LLCNLGFSFQKARFVSDHLDAERRRTWLTEEWPAIVRQAERAVALVGILAHAKLVRQEFLGQAAGRAWSRRSGA